MADATIGKLILRKIERLDERAAEHGEILARVSESLRYVATREDVSTAIAIHVERCTGGTPSLVARARRGINGRAKLYAALASAIALLAAAAATWLVAQ